MWVSGMNINEKIDLLMRLTKTTNSSMARFTAMDPSHLSRLRRGERSVAPGAPYLSRMAIYFARHCREEYQIRTLTELVKISPERMDAPELLADAIENWLYQEERHGSLAVEKFLEGMSQRPATLPPDLADGGEMIKEEECWCYTDKDSCRLLYGNHGKREAVLCFLEQILSSASQAEVLLFSDEDMDWMTEDRRFMMEWARLMMKIGLAGHQMTMIHTINRNLDEMLTAIAQWMPLYMTGAIKPYYFPKKRDGILKRTLFIAPGIGAVTSSSVIRPQPEQMILYLTDEQGIRSVREEFNQYFALCRPLMKIFTEKDYQAHLDVLTEFEGEEANSLIRTVSLSAVTMPEEVLKSVLGRMGVHNSKAIEKNLAERQRRFLANLEKKYSTEIIRLAKPEEVVCGRAPVPFSNLFGLGDIYYTREEYQRHLQYVIQLMEQTDQYQVCLSEGDVDGDKPFLIYAKEDLGVMVIRSGKPFAAFALNEGNMTAAFWDYLRNKRAECRMNRQEVLEYLKEFEKRIGEQE